MEALTSLWSVLHVDVQRTLVVERPTLTFYPACNNCLVTLQASRPFNLFFVLSLYVYYLNIFARKETLYSVCPSWTLLVLQT